MLFVIKDINPLLFSNTFLGRASFFFFSFFFFLGSHQRHREVPRLGVELELQLPASATATAMPDAPDRGQGLNPRPQGQGLNPSHGSDPRTTVVTRPDP